jgi:hypothetical protein
MFLEVFRTSLEADGIPEAEAKAKRKFVWRNRARWRVT